MRNQLGKSFLPPLTDLEFKRLLLRCREGDEKAREKLVNSNLRLVYSIAQRFFNTNYELEDLFQIGSIGLIKAIDNFDLSYEVKFSTYAVPLIMGEIRRYLRDDGPIKVSRSLKELAFKVLKTRDALAQQLEREPKIGEIAEVLQLSREEVVTALEVNTPLTSLHQPLDQDEGESLCLVDRISNKEKTDDWLDRITLRSVLQSLGEREKKIVVLRFLQNKTQLEVAKVLGISQVQVSRLEKKIINSVKKEFG